MNSHRNAKWLSVVFVVALLMALAALPAAAADPVTVNLKLGTSAATASGTTASTAQFFVGAGSWRETYPSAKMELYLDPAAHLGHDITVADIAGITYHTFNDGTNPNGVDFGAFIYTELPGTNCTGSWYCHRLTAEPYYSLSYAPAVNAWTTWNTAAGANQLTWYDQPVCGAYGFAGQTTTWADILAGPIAWSTFPACSPTAPSIDYRAEPVLAISFQTGSGWSAFDGFLDGITVTLTNGDVINIDLEDGATDTWVDDDWTGQPAGKEVATGKFMGYNAFAKIQEGIDAVLAGGTVNVYAGSYDETAANRTVLANTPAANGPHQFGLFVGSDKDGVKIQGVKADGSPITAYGDVATTITTNATNNFGASGIFVEGDDVVISGLGIGRNIPGDNKTVEVIGENVTLKNNVVDVPASGGALYFGDWRYDAVNNISYITKYTVEGNWLKRGGSVNIASGAGYTGLAADRKIVNNKFTADDVTPARALISFNGTVPSVGWYVYPTSGATITGNDFSGATDYIRKRGTVNEASFDWATYWTGNTFDKAAMASTDGTPASPRAYDYTVGTYTYNDTKRIGSVIQQQIDIAQAGDTILVKAGAYVEQVTVNKLVTLKGAGSDASGTVLSAPSGMDGSTGVVQLTGSGTSARPILIKDLRVQPVGVAGISVGKFTQSTGTTVEYVTLDNVKVIGTNTYPCNEQERGLFVDLTSSLKHLTVTNSAFDNLTYGWAFNKAVSAETSTVQYVTVSNTTFNHNNHKGIYVEKLSDATFTNVTVTDTAYDPSLTSACWPDFVPWLAGIDINLKAGTYTNLAFNNVTATNNAPGSANGANLTVKARGTSSSDSSYSAFPATVTGVTVTGGTYTGGKSGIRIGEVGKANTGPTGVDVKQANLSGNSAYGLDNQSTPQVKAENNWWGSACPAAKVRGLVDFDPWWLDPTGTATATGLNLTIPANATTAEQNAILACAAPGATINYAGSPQAGGVEVNVDGVTINLGGFTVGAGSPAFTINSDNVTLIGPGALDGNGSTSPAVLVNGGADNFTLKDVEVREWADGVQVAGAVESLKIVGNWFHHNGVGLQVDAAVDGVVTIEGNLFKENTGLGISSAAALEAQYNSWGDPAGAGGPLADGVSALVDASNPTYVEYWIDIKPNDNPAELRLAEGATFSVALKADARLLNGLTFQIKYPSELTLTGAPTFVYPWTGTCALVTVPAPPADSVAYRCTIINTPLEWNSAANDDTIATFPFVVETLPSSPAPLNRWFDIEHVAPATSAAAIGGVKVYVNNAGFGSPSVAGRDITDAQDSGKLILGKLAQYKGFIDLQGRSNDSAATLLVKSQQAVASSTNLASGTSAAGGGYTTALTGPTQLFQGETYWFQVDRALYLPTTALKAYPEPMPTAPPFVPTSWAHSKPLSSALQSLALVVLLGGDATNDDMIEAGDAGCIGGRYGIAPAACGTGGTSDVNDDGRMDILDLTLMGGNFGKTASPWAP